MAELVKVNYIRPDRKYFDDGIWGQMRRVALSQEGNVVGVHHKNDTSLWEDGTAVNWTDYQQQGWNCMVQIPKFYYKVELGSYQGFNDVYRTEVSGTPRPGFKLHPAFERVAGVVRDFQYMSAFEGWRDSEGRLRSLPGRNVTVGFTRNDYRLAAQRNENHERYQIQDFYLTSAIQMLFLTEYGNFDAQNMIGSGPFTVVSTGATTSLGNRTGYAGSPISTSYRGIENFYGNIGMMVDGMNPYGSNLYVAPNNFSDGTRVGHYVSVGGITNVASGQYAQDFYKRTDHFDFTYVPSVFASTPSNVMSDGVQSTNVSTDRIAIYGGNHGLGVYSGMFCWDFTFYTTASNPNIGSRLSLI